MLNPINKVEAKLVLRLIISIAFVVPIASHSQDTAGLRKEIGTLLIKYGIKNAGFELKVNSNNQQGGQTAFVINNNYNYTVLNDLPMYAKYNIYGIEPIGNTNIFPAKKTGLMRYMSYIYTNNQISMSDSSLSYCDSVINKFPNFPYGHFCKAAILLERQNPEWIKYAKQAVSLFEITTKYELHNPDHDSSLADLKSTHRNMFSFSLRY